VFIIDNVLITESVIKEQFVCNLDACKGACCVQGDSGAPLSREEKMILEEEIQNILPFIPESGKAVIQELGVSVIDEDGDITTPCVNKNKECAFTVFDENQMALCGIEIAYKEGKSTLLKPISCHLYPIRVEQRGHLEVLHYHQWHICSDACTLGKSLKIPVYKFLQTALTRKYGTEWFTALEELVKEYHSEA
jgi:hypothetical protein